ncbi:MAG: hypothetical protein ACFFCW_01140 [Candidatus Hodarchaeota archaeon]
MGKHHKYIDSLNDECNVFCYYLVNQKPTDYIIQKYQEGHEASDINQNLNSNTFNELLIAIAKINPFFTKLVDTYTCMLYKRSALRKKLLLLLAILESSASTHYSLDSPDSTNKTILFTKISQKGLIFILTFFLSTIFLMPLHVLFTVVTRNSVK